ncbi:hypothetical protein V1477_005394 [Vespula maculifrons]|uniref:Uncharacterized protein n=1 Tax=Vespula maculifrons TaxID=7453 RepID=A0ABD2CPI8_VESMC
MDHKQIISRDSDCPTFKSYVYWQNNMLHRRILLLFWFCNFGASCIEKLWSAFGSLAKINNFV